MRIQQWKYHPDFEAPAEASVRGSWEFELGPGEATIAHQHDDSHELDLIIEGSGRITVGDITRDVSQGDVVFVPAGRRHYVENVSSTVLRGITIEQFAPEFAVSDDRASIHDLEDMIASIPDDLDVSTALQVIIRLFDLAGYISEQIDETMGLENEAGYEALQQIELRVMDAVVEISLRYQQGNTSTQNFHPRF
ncbi:MAG: cupin domain-containing protein [Planctomycetes bacterium]|nr:cupin domain-containing protein [Planctomycetota bacterium]